MYNIAAAGAIVSGRRGGRPKDRKSWELGTAGGTGRGSGITS